MVHFHEEQVELALKIINEKSKDDEIKASIDILLINAMIDSARPTAEFVNAARQLNRRINEDYPEINEMHNIALNMARSASMRQEKLLPEYNVVLEELRGDLYGIVASVLLKHGRISHIKELIKSVD